MPIEQKRQSLLGIISLALSLIAAAMFFAGVSLFSEIILVLTILAQPVALLLGVIGLLQKNRKKDSALIGILISAAFIFFFLKMMSSGFRVPGI